MSFPRKRESSYLSRFFLIFSPFVREEEKLRGKRERKVKLNEI